MRKARDIVGWLAGRLPGWLFLLIGSSILAAMLLVPPWLQARHLRWQQGLQAVQAAALAEQEQAYRDLLSGLDANEPVLLERLAYNYLRLKPAGAMPLPGGGGGAGDAAEPFSNVDMWLARSMPAIGVDYPEYSPWEGWVTRMVSGRWRIAAAVGALICLGLGLVPLAAIRPPVPVPDPAAPPAATPAAPPAATPAAPPAANAPDPPGAPEPATIPLSISASAPEPALATPRLSYGPPA